MHLPLCLGPHPTARRWYARAALHVLDDPAFKVFVPQHALTLGLDYALVYMLLPEDPEFWLYPAIGRLRAERDQAAQKSLLWLLWYAQTTEGDKALSDFASDISKPDATRARAKELLGRKAETYLVQRQLPPHRGFERNSHRRGALANPSLPHLLPPSPPPLHHIVHDR